MLDLSAIHFQNQFLPLECIISAKGKLPPLNIGSYWLWFQEAALSAFISERSPFWDISPRLHL